MATEIVRIDRIATGGEGVGRLADGRVAFVPRTAPGDLARVEVTRPEKRFARATLVEVVEPGPDRVEPACWHYQADHCGGCQLQHLSAGAQALARQTILADTLTRIGKVTVPVPPVVRAEEEWRYRSKISLTRVTDGTVGYHQVGAPGTVFQLGSCWLADPQVDELWQRVAAARRLLPVHARRIVLKLDRARGEHVVVETGPGPVWSQADRLHQALSGKAPLTVWWQPEAGAVRAVAGSRSAYPATAFEQVHPAMGDRVRQAAIDALGSVTGRKVWDLYAGIGETADLLAERGAASVVSVERDGLAVEEAERRQGRFGRQVERVVGRVEAVGPSLGKADLVVTNPPRAGMEAAAIDAIRAVAPERVVYVSCDPATLARDVARFASSGEPSPSYRLAAVQGFDLFPQTAHLETVAVLERA